MEGIGPQDLAALGTKDGRGRVIRHLYDCTVRGRSGREATVRFGGENEQDAREAAQEWAEILFEETARECLASLPNAKPAPNAALVHVTLEEASTGNKVEYDYEIPAERQPNAGLPDAGLYYHF